MARKSISKIGLITGTFILLCVPFLSFSQNLKNKFYQSRDGTYELFLSDSLYEFRFKQGMWYSYCSHGSWKVNNGSVLLNSDTKQKIVTRVFCKESQSYDKDSLYFYIHYDTSFDECNYKFQNCALVFGESDTTRSFCNNITVAKRDGSFKIIIYADTNILPLPLIKEIETNVFYPDDHKNNTFDICISINALAFNYMIFDNITFLKRGKKIIYLNNRNQTHQPISEVFLFRKKINSANLIKRENCNCGI